MARTGLGVRTAQGGKESGETTKKCLTDVRREKHHVEGGQEVVDALHVAASGVSNCPYVQYPLHRTLNLFFWGGGGGATSEKQNNKGTKK